MLSFEIVLTGGREQIEVRATGSWTCGCRIPEPSLQSTLTDCSTLYFLWVS